MVSACYWHGRLCFGRGRDRGFVFDAAGKAVVEGIVVGVKNDADDVDACGNANDGEACDDADDGDEFDDADSGFDSNEYVGAFRDSVDGSGRAFASGQHERG